MIALLDVNVLLALAWPNHLHHEAAHTWMSRRGQHGWATCSITQQGFVRLSNQPSVVQSPVSIAEALRVLHHSTSTPEHHFWSLDEPLMNLLPAIRLHVVSHRQLTDGVLLDLAIRRGGQLATFDRGIRRLLPDDSPHQSHLEIIPA